LSGRGLCDELITRPEESYRLCCVVVCNLETSRTGAPYIYDISRLRVKSASANVSFYTNNSKMPNFELWHSCRKWAYIRWNVLADRPTDKMKPAARATPHCLHN